MHYYCQCLNISIDILAIETTTSIDLDVHLIPFANLSEEWLECRYLSEQSIQIIWQNLLQCIIIRDMELYRCLVCNQYTHIIKNQSNRILINRDLLDEKTAKDRCEDSNYSKILKIVLPNGMSTKHSTAFPDEIFQREYELVQQIYRQSLEDADRETEEKIRIYQHEQEELLQRKTEAINKELDTFLHVMRSTPRRTSHAKMSPILHPSLSYINENSMESGFGGSDVFDTNGTDFSRQSSIIDRAFSERSDTHDEDPLLDHPDWYNGNDSISNFATSLPKEIAVRPWLIPQQNIDENDDLERIGKSFRELSQSLMCTDGTELFGDLPSPRLNARPT